MTEEKNQNDAGFSGAPAARPAIKANSLQLPPEIPLDMAVLLDSVGLEVRAVELVPGLVMPNPLDLGDDELLNALRVLKLMVRVVAQQRYVNSIYNEICPTKGTVDQVREGQHKVSLLYSFLPEENRQKH